MSLLVEFMLDRDTRSTIYTVDPRSPTIDGEVRVYRRQNSIRKFLLGTAGSETLFSSYRNAWSPRVSRTGKVSGRIGGKTKRDEEKEEDGETQPQYVNDSGRFFPFPYDGDSGKGDREDALSSHRVLQERRPSLEFGVDRAGQRETKVEIREKANIVIGGGT